jgi:hypothetical protein
MMSPSKPRSEAGRPPRRGAPSGTLGVQKDKPTRQRRAPVETRYVGIDLHRRRSVIVHKDSDGKLLETVHLDNDPAAFAAEL